MNVFALLGLGGPALGIGSLWSGLKTGTATLDRLEIRGLVALFLPIVMGEELRHGPAWMLRLGRAYMAILHQESRGDPRFYLGDQSAGGGPSVGPGQVYRATAVELGLWSPPAGASEAEARAAYAAMKDRLGWGLVAGISVFKEKLRIARALGADAGHDLIWSAVRRYNGGGPMAAAYRERVLAFYRQTWGEP